MVDMDIDFSYLIFDDEESDNDDVDIYEGLSLVLLANDQADVLDYYELSELSGDEFLEESAGSVMDEPAAPAEVDGSPQALEFSDDDLLDADLGEPSLAVPSTSPSSPAAATASSTTDEEDATLQSADDITMEPSSQEGHPTSAAAAEVPIEDETAAVEGCDPAVMYMGQEQLDEMVKKLPFPPLKATLDRWRERTASPAMMEYIQRIRNDKTVVGPTMFFLPYNLRDKLIAMKERKLALGPYMNRKLLIDEYRLRKERESWKLLE